MDKYLIDIFYSEAGLKMQKEHYLLEKRVAKLEAALAESKTLKKGTRFGKLKIIEKIGTIEAGKKKRSAYRCLCDCVKEIEVLAQNFKSGNTTSCSCGRKK